MIREQNPPSFSHDDNLPMFRSVAFLGDNKRFDDRDLNEPAASLTRPMNTASCEPTVVAIIPARGGSKGIPGKNLAIVGDKPLIAHTIDVALATKGISRIVVTTDSPRIAEVARSFGAEVPFLRPSALATDDAPGRGAWKHAIEWLEREEQFRPALTLCLQPTSPLRTSADLVAALEVQREQDADWVIGVMKAKALLFG